MKPDSKAMFQLIAGAIMISFSAVFARLVSTPPTVTGFYRVLFGGVILLGIMLWRRERVRVAKSDLLFMGLAALCFAADLMLWHRSILYVGPGLATLLANFQVFVLAAVGVLFFKERLSLLQTVAIVLAMVGLGLLVGSDWAKLPPLYHLGVLFGLATAGVYAGYLLSLRRVHTGAEAGSVIVTMTVVSLTTAVILAAAVGIEGDSFAIPHWSDAGWLLLYGVFPQALGWVMISNAMPHVRAAQVGLVLLLQPTGSIVWDCLFFGRRFTAIELVGAVIALAAIYIGTLKAKQPASAT